MNTLCPVHIKAVLDRLYAYSDSVHQLSYRAIAKEVNVSVKAIERIRRILKARGILSEQGNTAAMRYFWNKDYSSPTSEMANSIARDTPPKKRKKPLSEYSIEALVSELRDRGLIVECYKKY